MMAWLERILSQLRTELENKDRLLEEKDRRIRELERELKHTREELEKTRLELEEKCKAEQEAREEIQLLKHRLSLAARRLYGRKSERSEASTPPLPCFKQALEESEIKKEEEPPAREQPERKKRRPKRQKIPPHLPCKEERHNLSEEERICPSCNRELKIIGTETTEEVEYEPARFWKKRIVREKGMCPCCKRVVVARMPPRPIEKGKPGPGLLAGIATAKYADHLPLYRQERIFNRSGIWIPRSTMSGWLYRTADLLEPIYEYLKQFLLSQNYLQADDTTILIKNGPKGKVKRGFLRAYTIPYREVVFEVLLTQKQEEALRFLQSWQGILQSDATRSFDLVYALPGVLRGGCMSHCRRGFFDARVEAPDKANRALGFIRRLYAIEDYAREKLLDAEARAELRAEKAEPIALEFRDFVESLSWEPLPKSYLGRAINYTLRNWQPITLYLKHGEVEIDNNSCENALRIPVLGRKNWLMLGIEEDPHRAAIFFTLTASCSRLGVDPFEYLRHVIEAVSVVPESRIWELTPRGYLEAKLGIKIPNGPPYQIIRPP